MKFALTIIAIIVLGFSVWFGLLEDYRPMGVTFVAFVLLLLCANLDRIKWFKIGQSGVEAETREVIEEAKSTIKELQSLSKIMATTTLGLVKRTGRWGGYSYDEKEEVKESTLKVLREIGVSEEEIEKVVSESKWHEFVEFDYALSILGGSRAWPPDLPEDLRREWIEFRRKFGFNNIAKPEDLTEFLDKYGLLSDEAKELIKDYEYYIKHRKQRRPQVWSKREEWTHLRKTKKTNN